MALAIRATSSSATGSHALATRGDANDAKGHVEQGKGQCDQPKPPHKFRTAKVKRGNLQTWITAMGQVKPSQSVEVGSQLTGTIKDFGRDASGNRLDFGSEVLKDQVLAEIDPTIYQAQVDSAKASLVRATADLKQIQARCNQALQDWLRAKSLLPENAIAASDYEMATTNYQVASAAVAVGEATIQQCSASLKIAETNLSYTKIKSPIDGIIIDRRVDVGQTVIVSFMNAPGLFLIAKDLHEMQVWASVKEADIGHIHIGGAVRFTVDARPGEVFEGKVAHVRLNATRTTPAASYFTVVVDIADPKNMYPYLTANLQFEVDRRPNVLLVPNTALQAKPETTSDANAETDAVAEAEPASKTDAASTSSLGNLTPKAQRACSQLLVKVGDSVRPIDVQIGTSDGSVTEVTGDNVKEGMDVVLGDGRSPGGA
jgi:HlyD family secretion protein